MMGRELVDAIQALPPRYPHVGHQYVCGYNDGKWDAGELAGRIDTASVTAVREAQAVLAEFITPDSGMTEEACIDRLLGILDDRKLVIALNPAKGGDK